MAEITQVKVLIHDFEVSHTRHEVDWSATLTALDDDGYVVEERQVMLDAFTVQEITDSVGSAVRKFLGPGLRFDESDLPDYEDGESEAILTVH